MYWLALVCIVIQGIESPYLSCFLLLLLFFLLGLLFVFLSCSHTFPVFRYPVYNSSILYHFYSPFAIFSDCHYPQTFSGLPRSRFLILSLHILDNAWNVFVALHLTHVWNIERWWHYPITHTKHIHVLALSSIELPYHPMPEGKYHPCNTMKRAKKKCTHTERISRM